MDVKILSEQENALLKRREVVAEVSHPGKATPHRKEMIEWLAKSLKARDELVIVEKVFTSSGTASCQARVLVYQKKEDIPREKLEKQARRLSGGKPKEGEAPKEGKPEGKKETPGKAEENK